MNRRLARVLALSIILSLVGSGVVFAQKSRKSRSARSSVKKKPPAKRGAVSRQSKRSRGRSTVASGRRRGRVASRTRARARSNNETRDVSAAPRMPSGIPSERVMEIQAALGKLGYYEEEPTGQWDENTVEAMKRFQTASRLPATGLPSARALKRLGVSKNSNDGYSVPIKSVSQKDKKP